MNKQEILNLLKEINYPGFSRDIVSFGMIENVEIDGKNVSIALKITTDKDEKKQTVVDAVKNILQETNAFENINVTLTNQGHTPPPLNSKKHLQVLHPWKE